MITIVARSAQSVSESLNPEPTPLKTMEVAALVDGSNGSGIVCTVEPALVNSISEPAFPVFTLPSALNTTTFPAVKGAANTVLQVRPTTIAQIGVRSFI